MTGRYLKRGVGSGYLRDFVSSISKTRTKASAVQSCLAAVQNVASRPPAQFSHTNGGSPGSSGASSGRELAADSSCTCAGFLLKRCRKKWLASGPRWKQHYFVLEAGTADKPPRFWYSEAPDSHKVQGSIKLSRCTVSAGGSGPRVHYIDEELENCFEMREGPKGRFGRTWLFRCESSMEREVWVAAINEELERLQNETEGGA